MSGMKHSCCSRCCALFYYLAPSRALSSILLSSPLLGAQHWPYHLLVRLRSAFSWSEVKPFRICKSKSTNSSSNFPCYALKVEDSRRLPPLLHETAACANWRWLSRLVTVVHDTPHVHSYRQSVTAHVRQQLRTTSICCLVYLCKLLYTPPGPMSLSLVV